MRARAQGDKIGLVKASKRIAAGSTGLTKKGIRAWMKAHEDAIQSLREPLLIGEHAERIGTPAAKAARGGLNYIHGYKNYDTPFCGQAAIATVWDHWGCRPDYCGPRSINDPYTGGAYWNDWIAVGALSARYPFDVGGQFGTSPNRICDALRDAQLWYGWAWGPQQTLDNVRGWVDQNIPVICLIWPAYFGWSGQLELHYVVVYKFDGDQVYFANPVKCEVDPHTGYGLEHDTWRTARCSTADFDGAWRQTVLTKCHIVGHAR